MIYHFTGTGNSLRAASRLAALLHAPRPVAMAGCGDEALAAAARDPAKVFVFPVYAWGLPAAVGAFIRRLPAPPPERAAAGEVRAVLTCGDDTGRTDRLLAKALAARGYSLRAVYAVRMRNTYVCLPGFDTDGAETLRAKEEDFAPRMERIAQGVARGETPAPGEALRGRLPLAKSYVLRPLFRLLLTGDRRFRADSARCTRCGRCAEVCPLRNISLEAGRAAPQQSRNRRRRRGPVAWNGRCTHCLACYHACPRHAIAYGLFTRRKGQVAVAAQERERAR